MFQCLYYSFKFMKEKNKLDVKLYNTRNGPNYPHRRSYGLAKKFAQVFPCPNELFGQSNMIGQQTIKICTTDTWKNDSRTDTLYTLVSEEVEKKPVVTRSQYEFTRWKFSSKTNLMGFFSLGYWMMTKEKIWTTHWPSNFIHTKITQKAMSTRILNLIPDLLKQNLLLWQLKKLSRWIWWS